MERVLGKLRFKLSSKMTDSLRIEQRETFFWPGIHLTHSKIRFVKSKELPEAYVFHLWKSAAQDYI